MDLVDLARLQFASTTLFHYLFVPLTLGLAPIVAFVETRYRRTGDERYLRLVRFLGALLLINFAMGVVTGIVQEFEFGMNWSVFSRFVGDVFGAPLAMEGMLAFFLESTFLGLWLFGRDRLPARVHLAAIWLFALGTWLSAYFIIVANSWMQHPVGYAVDREAGRARLEDIVPVLTSDVVLWGYLHTVLGGLLAASIFIFAVSAYHLRRRQHLDTMRWTWKLAIVLGISAGLLQGLVGDVLGVVMTDRQPMKIAAGEALWETAGPAPFAIVAWPDEDAKDNRWALEVPYVLSLLATNSLDGEVRGINDIQAEYEQTYGPGNYIPNVWVAFYSFRGMIGFGLIGAAWMAYAWWRTRRDRLPDSRWFWVISVWIVVMPWLGNLCGWIYTEMGRQPWIVFGELKTADAVSDISPAMVVGSLIVFYALYGAFGVIEFLLLRRYAILGPADADVRVEHAEGKGPAWTL